MAIPIFRGGGSGGEPATVRQTRIGPEDPRPIGLEAMGQAGKELSSTFLAMDRQQQMNLRAEGRSQWQNSLFQQGLTAESEPFTTPKDYMATWDQVNDPKNRQAFLDGMKKQGASSQTLNYLSTMMDSEYNTSRVSQLSRATVLGTQKAKADLDSNLQDSAQNAALAIGDANKQKFRDQFMQRLAGAQTPDPTTGARFIKADEAVKMQAKFDNQEAMYTGMDYVQHDPADALANFNNPEWVAKNPIYKNLTPSQHETLSNEAHKQIMAQINEPNMIYKQQLAGAQKEWYDLDSKGQLTDAMATEFVHHYPDMEKLYELKFGRKAIPAGGDPGWQSGSIAMLSTAKTPEQVEMMAADYDAHYGTTPQQRSQFHQLVTMTKETLATGHKATVDAWKADNNYRTQSWAGLNNLDLSTDGDPDDQKAYYRSSAQMERDFTAWAVDPKHTEADRDAWVRNYMAKDGQFERNMQVYGWRPMDAPAKQKLNDIKKTLPSSGPLSAITGWLSKTWNTPENPDANAGK